MVIVNFIPCPKDTKSPKNKCPTNEKLGYFSGYFESTFSEEYNKN